MYLGLFLLGYACREVKRYGYAFFSLALLWMQLVRGWLLLRAWWDGSVWFERGLPRCVRMHSFGMGMGGLAFV